MAYNGFAMDYYLDADAVRELDVLIRKPVYSVRPDGRLKPLPLPRTCEVSGLLHSGR